MDSINKCYLALARLQPSRRGRSSAPLAISGTVLSDEPRRQQIFISHLPQLDHGWLLPYHYLLLCVPAEAN